MNALALNTIKLKDLASIARHIGAWRGDEARTKKIELVNILTAQPHAVVAQAIADLGIEAIDSDIGDESKAATVATVQSANGVNPGDMLAQAIAMIAGGAVNEDRVRALIDEQMGAALELVQDAIAKASGFTRVEVSTDGGEAKQLDGIHHKAFPKLLQACGCRLPDGSRLNVWLTGPAGSGKTTAAKNVAKALDLDFAAIGTSDNKYEVTGFFDANGNIVSTEFKRIYRDGGVLLLDEVDGWFSNALLALNAATANGYALFPDGMIQRHPDCVIICAANTFGQGATADYVGRMKQDAAFLDRFVFLAWGIDEDLEMALAADSAWCATVQKYRDRAAKLGFKVLITPRATLYGCALLQSGMDKETVIEMTIRKGMSDDQWQQLAA